MAKDKCMEFLRVELTKEEVYEFGRELARKNNELGQIEVELQAVKAQFKERQTRVESSINTLSRLVSNEYDHREVECLIVWNKPVAGQCTIVRTDTGEEVRSRMMSMQESQELLPFRDDSEKLTDSLGENTTIEHDGKVLETMGDLRDAVEDMLSPSARGAVDAVTRATESGENICPEDNCLRFANHKGECEPDSRRAADLDKLGTLPPVEKRGKKAKA